MAVDITYKLNFTGDQINNFLTRINNLDTELNTIKEEAADILQPDVNQIKHDLADKVPKKDYAPEIKTGSMTQPVGKDENGKLWTTPYSAGGNANYIIELSTNEEDAQANSDAVTAAIAEYKHVVLKAGNYPVKPGIVIDSGKLDMNGAHFYTVDYKSSTPLIKMTGEAPEICNGELEGSYNLADDEEGYEFFESESLIFSYGVNDAYIHHMELHNNWGYCICTGTENEKKVHYVGTAPLPTGNTPMFMTDVFEIPDGYKYVAASGQIGYNRIISVQPVTYYFYDENGTQIRTSNRVPKVRIAIPNDAKTMKIATVLDDMTFKAYNVYFTNYQESLTVSDCRFHNFHSLGMAGFEGPTKVIGCSFIESGKPRSDANGTKRSTTGGIDIEDVPCPEFYMANCYSRDCAKLLMFGGYKGVVTNCIGDGIGVYRGWQLDISDCNISTLYTMGSHIRVIVNGVHADFIDIKEANKKDVSGSISTYNFPSNQSLSCFNSFFTRVTDYNSTFDLGNCVLRGTIKAINGFRSKSFAPAKGSHVIIEENLTTLDKYYYGIITVTGDSYGIESNTALFPNGYTIYDSTFTIADMKSGYASSQAISGAFKNCVFNLKGATYFKNSNAQQTEPIDLTFTDCIINNADYCLFNFVPQAGGVITFKNCTIADESKLFNGDASRMTINILTGDDSGVSIDASLSVEGAAADAKAVGDALANVGGRWRQIADIILEEEVANVDITKDMDGKAFKLKEFYVLVESKVPTGTAFTTIKTIVNGCTISNNTSNNNTTNVRYYYCYAKFIPGVGALCWHDVGTKLYNHATNMQQMLRPFNNLYTYDGMKTLTICPNDNKAMLGGVGTTIKVFGLDV